MSLRGKQNERKNEMKKLMVGAAIAAIACGCVSVNKNDGGNSCLRPRVIKDGMQIKYEVGKNKVSGTDQINCMFGFICWGSTATHDCDQSEGSFFGSDKVKNGAYANACDAGKCDQIVAARYTITTDDYFVFKKVKAEVSGFPVTAKSVEVVDALKIPALAPAPAVGGFSAGSLLNFIK